MDQACAEYFKCIVPDSYQFREELSETQINDIIFQSHKINWW